jgi:chaperonin GroEL
MLSRGPELQNLILGTLKTCSDLVGSTLGPGGMSVVIERQEENLPPIITKDGVTVFRSLGFVDPTAHVLMEAARDASIRTASEAGDGTTTATILAESFVRKTQEYCNKNQAVSPQFVVRTLQRLFKEVVEPKIDSMLIRPTLSTPEGQKQLHSVAKISANGDHELANAVMQCFDIIGDSGNVTIVESTGPSKYMVQKIEGYPVPCGFEDSCGPFYQKFVNDPGAQQTLLERPTFILYHGRVTDFNSIFPILNQVATAVNDGIELIPGQKMTHNVVIIATGYSETVLANLAAGFVMEGALNVFPLLAPMSPVKTGQYDFLMDMAAMTGGQIFDQLEKPLQNFELKDLGCGPTSFEATRFRSSVIGYRDELLLFERIDQIEKQLTEVAASELDKMLLRERLAKLTSGIAKLIVQGPSHGEVKERRDRAEDAVCAVRGAIKHGALPGGGVVLREISRLFEGEAETSIERQVMGPALMEPIYRLYTNAGFHAREAKTMAGALLPTVTYDVLERKYVDALDGGILDSAPAVREAIRNSISIASLLGTCGGTVVFKRDTELEREEARSSAEFVRNTNEANERP